MPFLPLQTLWVNFTTQLFQAIGLGYGKPAEGLMERKPRPPDEPILAAPPLLWLVIAGSIMAPATLGRDRVGRGRARRRSSRGRWA